MNDANIELSYIVTTFNKLPFLREGITRLVSAKKEDEEIVVVDGGSSDGTVDFLASLYKSGCIDQLISEKDFGESHGWNKAILMSRGKLIKVITDDDLFDFKEISHCRGFMEHNTDVDITVTPALNVSNLNTKECNLIGNIDDHEKFETERLPINTCGLGILLRKSSIPLLGLMNTSFVWVDFEYLSRVFRSKANIAYYSKPVAIRFGNSGSNSFKFAKKLEFEKRKISNYYSSLEDWRKEKLLVVKCLNILRSLKHEFIKRMLTGEKNVVYSDHLAEGIAEKSPKEIFSLGESMIEDFNSNKESSFSISRAS